MGPVGQHHDNDRPRLVAFVSTVQGLANAVEEYRVASIGKDVVRRFEQLRLVRREVSPPLDVATDGEDANGVPEGQRPL